MRNSYIYFLKRMEIYLKGIYSWKYYSLRNHKVTLRKTLKITNIFKVPY